MKERKPRLGLLGIITDGYESIFPGILKQQLSFAHSTKAILEDKIEVVFDGIATNQNELDRIITSYDQKSVDGILVIMLAYSQGAWTLKALRKNTLPLAVAVIQTNDDAEDTFNEYQLTINQGIHGAQDLCNALTRNGLHFERFAGSLSDPQFKAFVEDFAYASYTKREISTLKVGTFGKMKGMGDILVDEFVLLRDLGVEICYDSLGEVIGQMSQLKNTDIDMELAHDVLMYDVDPKLNLESHTEAIKMYLGFKNTLLKHNYDAFSAHFDLFGQDGRFKQLPLYAASRLMADGFGYAAEGDVVTAMLNRLCSILTQQPSNFSEMYMMDHKRNAILLMHAGEANPLLGKHKQKPRLIDRFLGEGGLGNPPTILFETKTEKATLCALTQGTDGLLKMIVCVGEVLDEYDLKNCEMPYFFFRPNSGVKHTVERWLEEGGPHHEVLILGDWTNRLKMWCELTKTTLVVI
jgi:L-arabinose isomerase